MDIGFYGLRKVGRFVKRLYRWIPVLWKQEEWDYGYMYNILELKLKELLKCIQEDDLHVEAPICSRQIKIYLKYLDRYRNPDKYIKMPEEEIKFDEKHRMVTSEEFSKACVKSYYFEEHSRDKFWKRFTQWHTKWWV